MSQIHVKQIKSAIGTKPKHRGTLRARPWQDRQHQHTS